MQLNERPLYAYVLRAPITGIPIYVGKGDWDRAFSHRFYDSAIGAHIRGLVAKGQRPTYERILAKDADEAFEMEEFLVDWIGRQDNGTGPLFNRRPGGRKVIQSEATRKKLSASHMGKTISAQHRASISKTLTGRKQSAELKAAHSVRMKQWWADRKSKLQVEN
jgi:hypothetical protein